MPSSASPPGGFVAVTSDDCKESDFHRGNPGERGTTDAIWSSTSRSTSSGLAIAHVLGTGVQLNCNSLDPSHGPVAETAARVMNRGRLVVVEKRRIAAAGGAAHAGKAPMDGSGLG
jgi:hypothetical protein